MCAWIKLSPTLIGSISLAWRGFFRPFSGWFLTFADGVLRCHGAAGGIFRKARSPASSRPLRADDFRGRVRNIASPNLQMNVSIHRKILNVWGPGLYPMVWKKTPDVRFLEPTREIAGAPVQKVAGDGPDRVSPIYWISVWFETPRAGALLLVRLLDAPSVSGVTFCPRAAVRCG